MLSVENISFQYDKDVILKSIDFKVLPGEHLSIIGESGSGKSTLLQLIYGEFDLNEGQIFWKETEILGPEHNLVAGYEFTKSVTQEFNIMPFITVAENVGKYLSNTSPSLKKQRIAELLEVVELTGFSNTKAQYLSGGQKQRVAIAKSLAKEPELLLLDEPFSHIDNFKKQSLRRKIFRYLKEKNIACLVATHNHEDVLGYADKMLVINNAQIEAYGTPKDLYNKPKTNLIASFFGEFNELPNYGFVYAHQLKVVVNSEMKAVVEQNYYKGNNYLIQAKLDGNPLFFEHGDVLEIGESVCLKIEEL
ncbi:ABC transporter ATP-binding protein [Urechidicola vernalis]|uniref:ABC transporter ATP-binding protein n=1 Tax=Urechidicola vernalis TaxID=3075600 RepID=A0ABU2Y581_9FLAO|nr:ABC transporter ATP-binding protein [Urechidicola sp. P050]MDT0553358.1 ABC transporter ATP-binding protein [Urechidicola sp. P050]